MALLQLGHKVRNVDPTGVRHACERLRAIAFRREKTESAARDPVMHQGVGPGVPGVTIREPFREDVLELGLQREDVADAWCGWRHVSLGVLLELEEIKVVTAILG